VSVRDRFEMCPVCGGRLDFAHSDEPCGRCKKKARMMEQEEIG